jgi:hypothetical protein
MIRTLIILVFCLSIFHVGFTQNLEQTVRGKITDKQTLELLSNVTVKLVPGNHISFSDSLGRFYFNKIPLGRYSISFSRLGYAPTSIPNLELRSGKEINLPVELEEAPQFLREVIVVSERAKDRAKNEMAMVSTRQFSVTEANRYAGGFQDPARMTLNFAGVTNAGSDQNNEIIIRGNSPKGLLWRMEGIEIPNPNHFGDGQGSTSGIISMINSTSLANSDFMSGAFPAEYGNASSGVFDLRFRRGNNEKREWMAQLSVVGIDLASEGPIGKNGGSYRAGARYSTLELLLKSGLININSGNFKPAYRDLNYTIDIPMKKAGLLTFWGLAGANDTEDEKSTTKDYSNSRMGAFGLSYKLPFKKGHLSTVLALTSESANVSKIEIISNAWKTTRDQLYRYPNVRLNATYVYKWNASLTAKFGMNISQLSFELKDDRWDGKKIVNYLNELNSTYYVQQFGQIIKKWTPAFQTTFGLHAYQFELNQSKAIEPRMAISIENNSGVRMGVGIGWHSRIEPISTYLFKRYLPNGSFVQPNKNITPSQALHQVVSYDQRIGENTRLKIEAYLQNINQVPVDTIKTGLFSMVNYTSGIPGQVLENTGKGINKGVELTLERFLADNFYYLVTASLFDSKFQNKDLVWRNTQFNNLFAGNILVGKDFKLAKQKSLSVNIRYLLRGGNRYTPINLAESIKRNATVTVPAKAFESQYPNFERYDFSLAYRINKSNHTWSFRLDLQNIFNSNNIIEERYDSKLKGLSYRYALPLIPIISSQIEF